MSRDNDRECDRCSGNDPHCEECAGTGIIKYIVPKNKAKFNIALTKEKIQKIKRLFKYHKIRMQGICKDILVCQEVEYESTTDFEFMGKTEGALNLAKQYHLGLVSGLRALGISENNGKLYDNKGVEIT